MDTRSSNSKRRSTYDVNHDCHGSVREPLEQVCSETDHDLASGIVYYMCDFSAARPKAEPQSKSKGRKAQELRAEQ